MNELEHLIISKLNFVSTKLSTYFDPIYYVSSPFIPMSTCNLSNPSPVYVMSPPTIIDNRSQTIIVNSDKKKDEKEKKDGTLQKVASVAGGVGLVFLGTYIVGKDEYINYWLTDIEKEIEELNKLIIDGSYLKPSYLTFKEHYNNWKVLFTARTKPKLIGKMSCIGSGMIMFGGLYFGSRLTVVGGIAGTTVGGCYLLWKWLTNRNITERDKYSRVVTTLGTLIDQINNQSQQFISPSCPASPYASYADYTSPPPTFYPTNN
jgi:hypothetical protein